jgi:predicted nucleotidyltransferase
LQTNFSKGFDASGWDVRKAASLLEKGNGTLVEWLHSPVIHHAEPRLRVRWQDATRQVFSPRAAVDHYRGLATQIVRGRLAAGPVRATDYLHALLAARWIAASPR